MTPKESWKAAHRSSRMMSKFDCDQRYWSPKFDFALEIATSGYDRLANKDTGLILGLLQQKKRVIANGGFWMGFGFNGARYNCRCSTVPIAL